MNGHLIPSALNFLRLQDQFESIKIVIQSLLPPASFPPFPFLFQLSPLFRNSILQKKMLH